MTNPQTAAPSQITQQSANGAVSTAVDTATNTAINVVETTNDFGGSNEVHVAFTADNAGGTAAYSKVYMIAGRGVAANKALPTGVTFSGDFATYADFLDYVNNVAEHIVGIRLQTDNTQNYSQKITLVNNTPNLQNAKYKNIFLSKYRQSTGNGYSDTLTIQDGNADFTILPQTNVIFDSLIKNSTVNVYFIVDKSSQSASVSPVNF